MIRSNMLNLNAIVMLLWLFGGCIDQNVALANQPRTEQADTFLEQVLPYLGFTPQLYDYAEPGTQEEQTIDTMIYGTIGHYDNLITHHLDDGIPWQEALEQSALPENVERSIQKRIEKTPVGHKVYLAMTPLAQDRMSVAPYWSDSADPSVVSYWQDKQFGDPEVFLAYYRFCKILIERFSPDYFAYAIEANMWDSEHYEQFVQFYNFSYYLYTMLKFEYPDLPIFLSVYVDDDDSFNEQLPYTQALLNFSDYVAVSSYPYTSPGINGDAYQLPTNWFQKIRDVAPNKPFAIAETGFNAEPLDMVLQSGVAITIPGTAASQLEYVRRLLEDADNANAKFVNWFVPIDYDALWEKISAFSPPLYKMWKDTGLIDQDFVPRPALGLWNYWLSWSKLLNQGESTECTSLPGVAPQRLELTQVSQNGIFDPSLQADPNSNLIWMSFSGVDGLAPGSQVSNHIAYSEDQGYSWCYVGRLNQSNDLASDEKPASYEDLPCHWNHEVSSLVYDPNAPDNEKWKVMWHRYLHINDGVSGTDDRHFEYGWVAMKAAATPEMLQFVPERKHISAAGYHARQDIEDFNDTVLGSPEIKLAQIVPALENCMAFTEYGLHVRDGILYATMVCGKGIGDLEIILLRYQHEEQTWSYVSSFLDSALAKMISSDLGGFSAPSLFTENNSTYLLVSPVHTTGLYLGCWGFGIDLETGSLQDLDQNGPDLLIYMPHNQQAIQTGACSYDPRSTHTGILYGEMMLEAPQFRIIATGIKPPRPQPPIGWRID